MTGGKLHERRLYAAAYRTALEELDAYRPSTHFLQVARGWYDSGVPADEAARWLALGYLPHEAAPLIADGVTPDTAAELEQLADDIAGSPEQRAMQRIDELVRGGVLVDPSRVRWQEDPNDPMRVVVDVEPE